MSFKLKNHPFAVDAYFKQSVVLTFAVPKEQLQEMIPECLTLDTFNNKWAFVAVAMVQTQDLRPKGFPKFLGNDFFLSGYRIFVRYTNKAGKNLRGLYILKSETDKRKMEIFGNIFTNYKYSTIDIVQNEIGESTEILSKKSGLRVVFSESEKDVQLPGGSPFADWKEARRYAGPLPFTFTYSPEKKEVLIIEGVRQHWTPEPVTLIDYSIPFLNTLLPEVPQLANAFIVHDIPYSWKKGKIEKWSR